MRLTYRQVEMEYIIYVEERREIKERKGMMNLDIYMDRQMKKDREGYIQRI